MTDTTDTAALREECAQWVKEAIGEAVDTRMALNGDGNDYMSWDMSVIWLAWLHLSGKLEAERQRADNYVEVAHGLAAELAALKGEQVPVAEIKFDSSTDKHPCMYWFGKQDRDFPVGTQFFTAPQKPVVLPKITIQDVMRRSGYGRQYAEGWVSANDNAIREIKAAGGIVKDGEQTYKNVCEHDWAFCDDGEDRFYSCTKCNSTTQ